MKKSFLMFLLTTASIFLLIAVWRMLDSEPSAVLMHEASRKEASSGAAKIKQIQPETKPYLDAQQPSSELVQGGIGPVATNKPSTSSNYEAPEPYESESLEDYFDRVMATLTKAERDALNAWGEFALVEQFDEAYIHYSDDVLQDLAIQQKDFSASAVLVDRVLKRRPFSPEEFKLATQLSRDLIVQGSPMHVSSMTRAYRKAADYASEQGNKAYAEELNLTRVAWSRVNYKRNKSTGYFTELGEWRELTEEHFTRDARYFEDIVYAMRVDEAADSIYRSLEQERVQRGLAPFSDEIPLEAFKKLAWAMHSYFMRQQLF